MVHLSADSARRSGRPQWCGRQGGRRQKRRQEQTRLLQLLVCLAIFLLVFIGKGVFPNRLVQVRDNLLSLITADVDFQAAFSGLGDSMSQGGTILDELGQFCVEVFGGSREDPEQPGASGVPELASMVVIDAVVRKLPGVLGAPDGASDESFADGLLEYPQYTRPANFRGAEVPAVLLSGNHAAIARWRREMSLERTARLRPDLLEDAPLAPSDLDFLKSLSVDAGGRA